MAELILDSVSQSYAARQIIADLSFTLPEGAIGCLLGPSGCGKTTALRCISGFEPIQAGEIRIGGEVVSRPGWMLPVEKRRVGMVFQDYALFPHLNVADNGGFGLRGQPSTARLARVDELLALVGLAGHAGQFPHQLSGGQQQRVALARALAPRPRLILMDEPFSNLDVELRERLSLEVRDILKREATTALIVTTTSTRPSRSPTGSASCMKAASSSGTHPTTCITNRRTALSPTLSARARCSPAKSSTTIRSKSSSACSTATSRSNATPAAATNACATAMSTCCCVPTTSSTTTTACCWRKSRTRPSAAPNSSTR